MTPHVLFIGLGGVGQRHLRNVRTLLGPQARLSAFRVRREKTLLTDQLQTIAGGDLEKEYQVEVFNSLEQALLSRPTIAVIANPTALHVPFATQAIKAGCHLFIEKPLSHNFHGVETLIQEARQLNRIAFVGYQLRFHPAVRALIHEVESGRVGEIYGARAEVAEYLPHFHPFEDYRRMYASRRDLGGGVTLTQIHEIDLIYRLFGVPEVVFSLGSQVSQLEIDVEDSTTSLLQFRRADNVLFGVQLHQDFLGQPARRLFSVWGSLGRLELNLRESSLDFVANDGTHIHLVDAREHPRNQLFVDEFKHFLECTIDGTSPEVSLEDGAASLQIALGLLESQRTGQAVQFDRKQVFIS